MRDYATSHGVTRTDGQPIGSWTELKNCFKGLLEEGKSEFVFDLKYSKFHTGWESEQQAVLMGNLRIEYRPWPSKDTSAPKGFFAYLLSKAASIKLGEVPGVTKRQEVADKNSSGFTIRVQKDLKTFDPMKNLRVRGGPEIPPKE